MNPKAELHSFLKQEPLRDERLLGQIDAADDSIVRYALALNESPAAALAWLSRPDRFLDHKTPLELATNTSGIGRVKEFMVRREYDLMPRSAP